ncbi:MAG: hypothetical protein ACK5L8_08490 [Marinicella pacifica]
MHRQIIYWILFIVMSLLTAFIVTRQQSVQSDLSQPLSPINVTTSFEVLPGLYYQSNGLFHLDLSGINHLSLPLKKWPLTPSQYAYLVIKDFHGYQRVHLYLTAEIESEGQATTSYRQKLVNNANSINTLDSAWLKAENLSDVRLVIEKNDALGFSQSTDNQIGWSSIQFMSDDMVSSTQQITAGLLSFNPLSYASINIYNLDNNASFRKLLTVIAVSLFIMVVLYLMLKPKAGHLMAGVVLLWLLASIPYGFNFFHQIQFNEQRFAENSPFLNQTDRLLFAMADEIQNMIGQHGTPTKETKIMIMGGDDFSKKRLNFHLLNHNTGIIGDIESWQQRPAESDSYAILLPPFNELCDTEATTPATNGIENRLKNTTRYCLKHR